MYSCRNPSSPKSSTAWHGCGRSKKRERLTRRFQVFLRELPRAAWTDDVSRMFGSIKAELERAGTRLEDMDLAIAAHALARNATLVSDNVAHMSRITDLRVENWRTDPADFTA